MIFSLDQIIFFLFIYSIIGHLWVASARIQFRFQFTHKCTPIFLLLFSAVPSLWLKSMRNIFEHKANLTHKKWLNLKIEFYDPSKNIKKSWPELIFLDFFYEFKTIHTHTNTIWTYFQGLHGLWMKQCV